jgi:hypothetical protein
LGVLAAVVRSRTPALAWAFVAMVVPQILLVPVTYVLAQMVQMMGTEGGWADVAGGRTFRMLDVAQRALAYDRWTQWSLYSVQGAILSILAVNLIAAASDGLQIHLAWIVAPVLGCAALVLIAGVCAGLLAWMGDAPYTFEMLGFYGIWIAVLVAWSLLVIAACAGPTGFKRRLQSAVGGR